MPEVCRRLLLLAAAAASFSGWPRIAAAAAQADTAVFAKRIDDIISLDPAEDYEPSGVEIASNIYDRLLRYEAENLTRLVGGVAGTWTVSDDGKLFIFKLRPNLKFHSGAPVTAEDAAFSLHRVVLLDKSPASLLTQLGWTKDNVHDLVQAPDPATLSLRITEDLAPTLVLNLLTSIAASVVEKQLALANEANGDLGNVWLKTHSAGSGAYKLVVWKVNNSVTLEAFSGFRLGGPHLRRVVLRHVPEPASQRLKLENADIDFARDLPFDQITALAGSTDIKVDAFKGANTWYIGLNLGVTPLASEKVRTALKYLVDYQGLASTVLNGCVVVQQSFLTISTRTAMPTVSRITTTMPTRRISSRWPGATTGSAPTPPARCAPPRVSPTPGNARTSTPRCNARSPRRGRSS